MTTPEPIDDESWSELRQGHLPSFEARLYLERAGLSRPEAVKWWERFVFSSEAAEAIAAGRTIEEELSRRESLEPARAEQRRADEQARRAVSEKAEQERRRRSNEERELQRAERDRLAADRDFLAGLSPSTAALVRQVTKVALDAETDYPCPLETPHAVDGRMMCIRWELIDGYRTGDRTEFDATFAEVLQVALDSSVYMIDIEGLHYGADVQLLSAPEYWPMISRLLGGRGGEPLYVNGEAYAASVDGLVHHDDDD